MFGTVQPNACQIPSLFSPPQPPPTAFPLPNAVCSTSETPFAFLTLQLILNLGKIGEAGRTRCLYSACGCAGVGGCAPGGLTWLCVVDAPLKTICILLIELVNICSSL